MQPVQAGCTEPARRGRLGEASGSSLPWGPILMPINESTDSLLLQMEHRELCDHAGLFIALRLRLMTFNARYRNAQAPGLGFTGSLHCEDS